MVDTPRPPGGWPLVGRRAVLDEIVAGARAGEPGVVLVGRPGSGRTRLLAEVGGALAATGRHVVAVTGATAVADLPFSALAGHLRTAVPDGADATRSVLADLVPERPTCFLVDEVEHLDPASAW